MDRVAEYGIASHWSYKEKGSVKTVMQNEMEQKLQFFRAIMDLRKSEDSPEGFVNTVKEEIFQNTIYVFTPLGDVIELPNGSTPIDFAYKVHTDVGEKTTGAIVNEHIVPLDYKLKNEDVVKIITNNNSDGPSREWLNFVQTTQAKNKIRNFFNRANREEYLKKGEEALNRELKRKKIVLNDFYENENIKKLVSVISAYIKDEDKDISILEKASKGASHDADGKSLISISGTNDIKVNLASCCKPVPGDRIVGYITKGYGVTVHRMVCPNVADLDERLIEVKWNETGEKLPTSILIRVNSPKNLLIEVVSKATNQDIPVKRFSNTHLKEDDLIKMTVLVSDKDRLLKLMNDIKMIDGVTEVVRMIN